MSNLDGQLKTIFREWLSDDNYSEEKAVELIRLAFTEAGYVESKPKLDIMMAQMQELVDKLRAELTRLKQTNGFVYTDKSQMVLEGVMSGKDFYGRFQAELDKKLPQRFPEYFDALEAAHKAAGLTNTEPSNG